MPFCATILRPFALLYYAGIKLLRPVRHKVTLIGRRSDSASADFILLAASLAQLDRSLKIKIISSSKATRRARFLGQLRQTSYELWHTANSSAVVLDGYAASVSFFSQRKKLYVLQMWHTLGMLKRSSWQTIDAPDEPSGRRAQALRMHANYTALLAPSDALRESYRHAFRITRTRIHTMVLPRYDLLRNPDMNRLDMIISNHPELFAATPLVLYAPSARGGMRSSEGSGAANNDTEGSHRQIEASKKLIQATEVRDLTLVIKPHPRLASQYASLTDGQDSELAQLLNLPHVFLNPPIDTLDLLAIVDHVITDYSSLAFEAATAGKPVWFYLYDHDDYLDTYGLNVDPTQHVPAACFADAQTLIAALAQSSLPSTVQEQFLRSFVQPPEKTQVTAAQQIARLVLQGIQ